MEKQIKIVALMSNDEFLSIAEDDGISEAYAGTQKDYDLADKWDTVDEAKNAIQRVFYGQVENDFEDENITFRKYMRVVSILEDL